MKSIYHFCQGESHKATNKPCQDCAYAESTDSLSMAIVSDGHGGERYFRSDRGSRLLVDISKNSIKSFVESLGVSTFSDNGKKPVFENAPFTSYIINKEESSKSSSAHKALQWLFASIITQWNCAIASDAIENDITEWEANNVEKQYLDEFIAKRQDDTATFEKTYGCTLMAYVQTPSYWFAFQLGDGKCVFVNDKGKSILCEQPIPWDERCFLNKTTSICDSEALSEFRYCYQGDGKFPIAVFLGSDGMDDTYGDGELLHDFYIKLYKQIAKSGDDTTTDMLRKSLPEISRVGSKDDMSVACIYDDSNIRENFFKLTLYQEAVLNEDIAQCQKKLGELVERVDSFGNPDTLSKSDRINYDYALKDLEKFRVKHRKLHQKIRDLREEVERYKRGQMKGRATNAQKRTSGTLYNYLKKK